jgi:NRAMP (natural resistance-associated macrophage protein)-like metal ion transporter
MYAPRDMPRVRKEGPDALRARDDEGRRPTTLRRFLSALGPGVITGAADDDPSGIATYSVAGAQLGTGLLWIAVFLWPLMASVQTMCARIGMVTGKGLMAALSEKFPRPLLLGACVALLIANTINIGADLAGMADAAELVTHVSSHVWVVVFGVGIAWATVQWRYKTIANTLEWLALVLFAYVITAIKVGPPWREVLHATLVPSALHGRAAWATLVAILGTTISPYLFFWQSSEEVEEEKALGRSSLRQRRGASLVELARRRMDVGVGTFFATVAMYFVMLTTALTLHGAGVRHLETSAQVAEALKPFAGHLATLLYALGIVRTGTLAIPTLAGSGAYALSELLGWREGMDERFRGAPAFYGVIVVAVAAGVGMDFANVSAVRALYLTAVLNGVLAPFLLVGILLAASDGRLMRGQPSSRMGRAVVAIATVAMFGAAVGMVVF